MSYKQTTNKQDKVIGLIGYSERVLPTLVRRSGNPTFSAAAQNPSGTALSPTTSGSIYWPYIVDVAATGISSPLDSFYMYYSTDHDAGAGGIWLATGPSPYGPWTGRGRVYVDTVSGSQSETPSVIWNDDESLFFMYYQQASVASSNAIQSTCLATSPDGINWTRVGLAVIPQATAYFAGDKHNGYFRPFRIGRMWYAYHLLGGGNYPRFGMSISSDGRTWFIHPKTLSYGDDQFTDGRRIEWNSGDVVLWRGQLWWVGMASNFTSGSTPKDARVVIAPLADDMRHLLGRPQVQLYPTSGSNESTNYRSLQAFVWNGKLIVTYQCDSYFNVATAG